MPRVTGFSLGVFGSYIKKLIEFYRKKIRSTNSKNTTNPKACIKLCVPLFFILFSGNSGIYCVCPIYEVFAPKINMVCIMYVSFWEMFVSLSSRYANRWSYFLVIVTKSDLPPAGWLKVWPTNLRTFSKIKYDKCNDCVQPLVNLW